jgi:hypothetical protein
MPVSVSDARSNRNDQIAHAVAVLGRSKPRIAVFKAIYFGKRKIKTVTEIVKITKLARKIVLNEAKRLANQDIVRSIRLPEHGLSYEKDPFYTANKDEILRQVANPARRKNFPTKYSKGGNGQVKIFREVRVPAAQAKAVTVDDIDSFARVRKIGRNRPNTKMAEATFKAGLQKIIGERGRFQDWGGEQNDLFTTTLRLGNRRRPTAFALKGPGLARKLTLARFGKNGNQLPRLFNSPAEVFLVQHWRDIDQDVFGQMQVYASFKSSMERKPVWYGVIDGQDSTRLIEAYPDAFNQRRRRRRG